MKLPADRAVISREKLVDYILSPTHPDGRAKAAYLVELGYSQRDWRILETDLRQQVLANAAQRGRDSPYGTKYEIVSELTGPNGARARVRTIWIILHSETAPGS